MFIGWFGIPGLLIDMVICCCFGIDAGDLLWFCHGVV
jgi:hypothetical protein